MLVFSHQKGSVLPTDNFNVYFNDIVLRNVESCKILGINVDNNLSWRKKHIDCVTSRLASTISLLHRISSYIDHICMILFYNSYIFPLFMYWANVWGLAADVHIHKLQVIQNRAARIVLKAEWNTSTVK